MEIIKLKLSELKPYEKNAKKHPKEQIEQIKKSIKQFGMNDPIGIWKDNTIIEGHGRYEALKELGYEEVDCIRLDHLTDEERRAYTLAHNKLTLNSENDLQILQDELNDLIDLDFDLDLTGFGETEIEGLFEVSEHKNKNERHRTDDYYNLDIVDEQSLTNDFWQMPIIKNDNFIPSDVIGFNYARSSKNKNVGIHFYLDDYQFERLWNNPEKYIDILRDYDCIFSPDFSLYLDMPMPMKIWNTYRSRQIGSFYQAQGIKVIPTISWAEKETFDFCFQGIPEGSVVSISTIGVKKDDKALKIWQDGIDEMIKRIKPSTIIVYGGKLDYDFKDINVVYFDSKMKERLKNEKDKN